MPTNRKTNHKIAAGALTVAQMASQPLIKNFPKQADQGAVDWIVDSAKSDLPTRARQSALSGRQYEGGFWSCSLVFPYLTFGMWTYLMNQLNLTNALFASATVQVYDESDSLVTIQGIVIKPEFGDLQPVFGGFRDVKFRIVNGTKL